MATYSRPKPSFEAASLGKNPQELLLALEHLHSRISDLEAKTGGASYNLNTQTPRTIPPPSAGVQVSAQPGSGRFIVQITNPQHLAQNPGNKAGAPIQHLVEFSDTPSFNKVVQLPITTQTYIETSQFGIGANKYVRVSNSFDGKNFNSPIDAGLHSS